MWLMCMKQPNHKRETMEKSTCPPRKIRMMCKSACGTHNWGAPGLYHVGFEV